MTWTPIKYGTWIVTGLIITGTLVYLTTRTQVKSVDIIELYQGLYERCLATYQNAGTSFLWPVTVTNQYTNFTFGALDASGKYWLDYDTNGLRRTNYYHKVTKTNTLTVIQTFPSGYYGVTPQRVPWVFAWGSTNRYIWGGYTQLVVSGITGATATNNGTYQWQSRSATGSVVADVYANTNPANGVKLYDYGYQGKYVVDKWLSAKLAAAYTLRGDSPVLGPWRGVTGPLRVSPSGLSDNLLRDAPCPTNEFHYGAMDWHTDSRFVWFDGANENDPGGPFTGAWAPDKYRALIMLIGLLGTTNHPYLDDSQTDGSGHFVGFTTLPGNNYTQFWARTGSNIGYVVTKTNYLDSAAVPILMWYDEQPGMGLITNYSAIAQWNIAKSNMLDRYEMLNHLKWTMQPDHFSVGGWNVWTTTVNNTFYWEGSSTNSWTEAKANCAADSPTVTKVSSTPYEYTVGTYDGSTWSAKAYARCSKLVIGLSTAMTCVIDWYDLSDKPSGGTVNTYGQGSTALVEDELAWWNTTTNGESDIAGFTSPFLGSSNFPSSVWCSEPSAGQTRKCGWLAVDGYDRTVAKWQFQYCTNAVP